MMFIMFRPLQLVTPTSYLSAPPPTIEIHPCYRFRWKVGRTKKWKGMKSYVHTNCRNGVNVLEWMIPGIDEILM